MKLNLRYPNFKPAKRLKFETRKQQRERAFAPIRKRTIHSLFSNGDPYGNRTHVCGVRGRRLNRLTNGPSSERTTYRSLQPTAKAHSFRRSSSSSQTRFAGLCSDLRGNFSLGPTRDAPASPSGTLVRLQGFEPGTH